MKKTALLILLGLGLAACASDTGSNDSESAETAMPEAEATAASEPSLTGAISYRDNSTIPPSADIYIRLLDITDGAEASDVVSDYVFEAGKSTIPFPFDIRYNPEAIQDGRTYALDVEIKFMELNLYYALEPIEVLSNGLKKDIAVMLVKGPKPEE